MHRAASLIVLAALGCGSATGLEIPELDRAPEIDAPEIDAPEIDAGLDADCRPLAYHAVRAEVALVLDRSGSMGRPLGDSTRTRAEVVRSALESALAPIDGSAALGAVLYPVDGASHDTDTVCDVRASIDVPIAPGGAARVLAAVDAHEPAGGTPTADALRVGLEALRAIRSEGSSQAMVLVTDGGPNCDPADRGEEWYGLAAEACLDTGLDVRRCIDDVRTLDALRAAASEGVPTYVIGMDLSIPLLVEVLDRMAEAGGVPRADTARRFYDVARPGDLDDALRSIASSVARCAFRGPDPETGIVTVGGSPVRREDWARTAIGIELHGEACDRAAGGAPVELAPHCP